MPKMQAFGLQGGLFHPLKAQFEVLWAPKAIPPHQSEVLWAQFEGYWAPQSAIPPHQGEARGTLGEARGTLGEARGTLGIELRSQPFHPHQSEGQGAPQSASPPHQFKKLNNAGS